MSKGEDKLMADAWISTLNDWRRNYWTSVAGSDRPLDAMKAYIRSGQCESDFRALGKEEGIEMPELDHYDDDRGMRWFNELTENSQNYWLDRAGSSKALDAWKMYKFTEIIAPRFFGQPEESSDMS